MPPFRVSREGGAGLPYSATRRVAWRSPTHGVRCAAHESRWRDLLAAIALVLRPGAAFSHQTAAQLLGLPLPAKFEDMQPVHVTVPVGASRGTRQQVVWHRAPISNRVITAADLPITDAGRTWMDLGSHLDLPRLVAVTDVILRRRLCSELVVPPRARGAQRLRKAAELADPRSCSPEESEIRVELILAGLPTPEVNFDVIVHGEWIGQGDLVWPEYLLYVEYDGGHHADPQQRHQDAQTRNRLALLGWRVRVVTSAMRTHDVVEMVTEDLRAAGWPG